VLLWFDQPNELDAVDLPCVDQGLGLGAFDDAGPTGPARETAGVVFSLPLPGVAHHARAPSFDHLVGANEE
jgi:hypothetical protein